MKQRGSAIIISMLMISAIGVIAFSIGRLLFWEVSAATAYENGAIAYYAAESGIEEGFLRYRYNQNSEIPYGNSTNLWTIGEDKVFRANLTDKLVNLGNSNNVGITQTDPDNIDSAKQSYDLRMGYIGTNGLPYYGQDVNNDGVLDAGDISDENYADIDSITGKDYSSLNIAKDEAYKVDLTNLDLASNQLVLMAQFPNIVDAGHPLNSDPVNKCKALIEIKITVKDPSGITNEYKALMNYDPSSSNCSARLGIEADKMLGVEGNSGSIGSNGFYYVKGDLRQIFTEAGVTTPQHSVMPYPEVSLFIKPLYYNAKIGLTVNGCDKKTSFCSNKNRVVSGPYTTVESTGYFGNSSRKLVANIDRQSGTVYDLFDYVINIQ